MILSTSAIASPCDTPGAGFAVTVCPGRIGCHAGDFEFSQEPVRPCFKPARVPGFDGHTAIESFPQCDQERANDTRLERETRRQLDEEAAEPRAERFEVWQERVEVDDARQSGRHRWCSAGNHHATIAVTDKDGIVNVFVVKEGSHVVDVSLEVDIRREQASALPEPRQCGCVHLAPS